MEFDDMANRASTESSNEIRKRVMAARDKLKGSYRALERLGNFGVDF